MSKKNSTVVSKVKKLMQEDEDVGKISQGAPAAIGLFSLKVYHFFGYLVLFSIVRTGVSLFFKVLVTSYLSHHMFPFSPSNPPFWA